MTAPTKDDAIDARMRVWAARIAQVPGVSRVKLWTESPGKERVYVDLTNVGAGKATRGVTGRKVIVDASGRVMFAHGSPWASPRTRSWHEENDTVGQIEAVTSPGVSA